MRTNGLKTAAIATALLVGTAGLTYAQDMRTRTRATVGTETTGTTTRTTVGTTSGSTQAGGTHGANQKGFCPPGQRKKPGQGSRFQC